MLFNAKNILEQLLQTTQTSNSPQGNTTSLQQKSSMDRLNNSSTLTKVGGGLLAGLLLGNKKARKLGGKAVKLGAVAGLGAIAFNAYRKRQDNNYPTGNQPLNIPQQQRIALDFDALPAAEVEDHSRVMLTAIIAAAKADGNYNERERQLIQEQAEQIGDADTLAWVQQELNEPLDVNRIAALATSPELASEIFLASLIVIDDKNEQEKAYLDLLAEKLGLEPEFRLELEQQLE